MIQDFLNPSETINSLPFLKDNFKVVDVGCGAGGWTIPLAKRLENGKVYAIDILTEPLSTLKGKLDHENIHNVELMLADIEKGVRILDRSIDLIIMSNVFFQLNSRERALEEAKRMLIDGGYLLMIDWKKLPNVGPKENAVSRDEMKIMAQKAGLLLEKDFDLGNYHWGLIFRK